MLVEIIYIIAMAGVIACNGLVLVAQYQLRKKAKTAVNLYVASLSVSAIIFACIFAPTVFTAYFQTLAPSPFRTPVPSLQIRGTAWTQFLTLDHAVAKTRRPRLSFSDHGTANSDRKTRFLSCFITSSQTLEKFRSRPWLRPSGRWL